MNEELLVLQGETIAAVIKKLESAGIYDVEFNEYLNNQFELMGNLSDNDN